jgi:hypothetical protein
VKDCVVEGDSCRYRKDGLSKLLTEPAENETSDIKASLTELERAIRDRFWCRAGWRDSCGIE